MRERIRTLLIAGALTGLLLPAHAGAQAILQEQAEMEKHVKSMEEPPAGSSVRISQPADGATVSSPVKVVMVVNGIHIKKAGELESGTGHHHLIIDGEAPALGEIVPKDETHLHYGTGATEATLELAPGKHTITAQVADGIHRSYGPGLRHTITITVR